jgi:hypothetical protein
MGGDEAPPPPDPNVTARLAAEQNRQTAITQYGLNATNQVTPYGNLTYDQIGKWENGDPRYQATTTLSPEQQNLYNLTSQTQSNLGNIGVEQSNKIRGILNTPFQLDNAASEGRINELASARLNPMLDRRRDALETKLYNQGVMPGTEAYREAMAEDTRGQNDALNQLLLTGRGQANQELLTQRNQPLNEISALMSGSQVQQPNFVGTPQTNVAPVDYAGIVNNNYQGQMAQYSADQAKQGAMYGAIGGMAGTALGGWGMGGFKGFGGK